MSWRSMAEFKEDRAELAFSPSDLDPVIQSKPRRRRSEDLMSKKAMRHIILAGSVAQSLQSLLPPPPGPSCSFHLLPFDIIINLYRVFPSSSLSSLSNPSPIPTIPTSLNPSADSQQPQIYGASFTVYLIAILSTALRFHARRITKARLWWDDWLIAASLFLDTALLANTILMLYFGLGRHYEVIAQEDLRAFGQTYLAGSVVFTGTLALAKYSILALYWRIFGHVGSIRLPIYGLLGLVMGWFVFTVRLMWPLPVCGLYSIYADHYLDR